MNEKEDYASDNNRDTRHIFSTPHRENYLDPRIMTRLLFAPPPKQVLLTEQSVTLAVGVEAVVDFVVVVLVAIDWNIIEFVERQTRIA